MSKRTGNGAETVEKDGHNKGIDRIKELEEFAKIHFEKAVLSNEMKSEKADK